jgi:plastocyanin
MIGQHGGVTRRIVAPIVLLTVFALLPGCGGNSDTSGPVQPVRITENVFTPTELSVPTGTVIEWTNSGAQVHNVVSLELDGLKVLRLEPGQTYRYKVTAGPGTYRYYCSLHATSDGKGQWASIVVA